MDNNRKLTNPCKKLFHTFEMLGRHIMICALVPEQYLQAKEGYVQVGVSITAPGDSFDDALGRKISSGRATTGSSPRGCYTHLRYVEGVRVEGVQESPFTYGLLKLCIEEAEELIRDSPGKYIAALQPKEKEKVKES